MASKLGAYTAVVAGGVVVYSAITGRKVIDVLLMRQSPSTSTTGSPTAPTGTQTPGSGSVLAGLFPAGVTPKINRHDQGRDLQVPAYTNVLALGDGKLIRNAFDPAGFGISYPIVSFTSGPWAGLDIYFGHTKSLLSANETFTTGQPISQTQNGTGPYCGNATGLPGWVEIGLAPNGNPGPFGQNLPPGL